MEILRSISLYAESKGYRFLVIGGHAVNFYGISRHTADIDLLVPLKDKAFWQETMDKLKYREDQNDNCFSRHRPINLDNWPIDFMYVNDDTFEKLFAASKKANFGDAEVQVAAAEHLIRMKLHALKYFQKHRFSKDYSDLIGLIAYLDLDYKSEDFKQQCIKHANIEMFERIKNDLNQNEKE